MIRFVIDIELGGLVNVSYQTEQSGIPRRSQNSRLDGKGRAFKRAEEE